MSYFLFRGVSSRELPIMVTKPILRPSWGNEYNEMIIAGLSRKMMQRSDTLANSKLTIETVITDTSPENIRRIYGLYNGYGTLQVSSAPQEYLDVIIDPLIPETVALDMAELPISMTVLPFAYAVEPTVIDLTSATSNTKVTNPGTAVSAPEIRLKPKVTQVSIYINNKEFQVNIDTQTLATKSPEIILDCDLQAAYYEEDGSKVDVTPRTVGDFPLLHTGDNYIRHDGNVGSMSINVKERWL